MANKEMKARVQQKIDTSANWAKATNFTPLEGEMIIYSDTNQIKIGDGVTKVNNLSFVIPTKVSELTNDSYFIKSVPVNLTLYTNADMTIYYEADRKAKEIYDAYTTGNRIFLTFNGNEYPLVTCLYSSNKYTLIFQNTDMAKKQISQFSLIDGTSAEAVQYTSSTYSLVDSISFTELGDIDDIVTVQAADEVSY